MKNLSDPRNFLNPSSVNDITNGILIERIILSSLLVFFENTTHENEFYGKFFFNDADIYIMKENFDIATNIVKVFFPFQIIQNLVFMYLVGKGYF